MKITYTDNQGKECFINLEACPELGKKREALEALVNTVMHSVMNHECSYIELEFARQAFLCSSWSGDFKHKVNQLIHPYKSLF